MDTLIAAIGSLVTGLANLIPLMGTTNQHLANITAPQPPTTPSHKYKPNPPRAYDGNPNRINATIQEHEIFFRLSNLTNDQDKILYVLGNTSGGNKDYATTWADAIRSQILSREEEIENANTHNTANPTALINVPGLRFANWKAFAKEMTQQFGLMSGKQEAIDTIRLIEQGNMTCEEYATVFSTHFICSGYNETSGLEEFKRGLNRALRMKLETTFPLPEDNADGSTNVTNWALRAVELDRQWRIANKRDKEYGNKGQNNDKPTQRTNYQNQGTNRFEPRNEPRNAPPTKDPNAMDIDRNRRSGFSGNFADATCYHCQKKGHIARNCPDSDKPKVFPPRGARLRTLLSQMTEEEREEAKKDLGF